MLEITKITTISVILNKLRIWSTAYHRNFYSLENLTKLMYLEKQQH